MKVFVLALLAAVAAALPNNPIVPFEYSFSPEKIAGGLQATKGQFPWQVINRYLLPTGYGFCGGALISSRWVLTAAHCVKGASQFYILLGTLTSDFEEAEGKIVLSTTKSTIHENFSALVMNHDIAVIDLDSNIEFTDIIKPIGLSSDYINAGQKITVSGWGKTTDEGTVTLMLNYVELTTITNPECRNVFSNVIDQIMCCNGKQLQSTCKGDSGGPLVQKTSNSTWVHVGISSFAHKEGCVKGYPSAHTRTSSYRNWIKDKTGV